MLFSAAASQQPIQFGAYLLTECVGQGGMAVVYKATRHGPSGFEKTVVVKAMLPTLSGQKEFVAMFSAEARLMAALTHPNIVQVHDFGLVDGIPYLAMEYLPGRNLSQLRAAMSARGQRLPVGAALAIARDMCHGLGYAHDFVDSDGRRVQVIHRDVSPSNIMVCRDGSVKLLDFGVAKIVGEFDFDVTQSFKGKYAYMSPEQVNHQPIDRRVDVFAAGVILHELLTGKRLFAAQTELETLQRVSHAQVVAPSVDNREVPRALDAIVKKALARDPKDRYASGAELAEALESLDALAWPRKRLAAFVAEIFADDWMIVCDVCGKQVIQGEECIECGTAAPDAPEPRALDAEARALSARQALLPLFSSMHGDNTDRHETGGGALPVLPANASEPLPLPPPPPMSRQQQKKARGRLSVVRTPLPPALERAAQAKAQAQQPLPLPPVPAAPVPPAPRRDGDSLIDGDGPATLPNIVLSPELQQFVPQPIAAGDSTRIEAARDNDTLVDVKRSSRGEQPKLRDKPGAKPRAKIETTTRSKAVAGEVESAPLPAPRLFVVPQLHEPTPALTPLPRPKATQSPLSTPRPMAPQPLFVVPPTPAPTGSISLKPPSRALWYLLGAVALVLLGAILLGEPATPPATATATSEPAKSAATSEPAKAQATKPAATATTPVATPLVKLPPQVVAPEIDTTVPARPVHKAPPPRRRVVRARPPAADAEPTESAPTTTVKEGRIVDPFAGLK